MAISSMGAYPTISSALNSTSLQGTSQVLKSSSGSDIMSVQNSSMANFSNFLSNALAEVDQAQKVSDQMSVGMLLGSVEIHQATIAMDKASLTLRTFVQVRDKVLEAYQEIMRMQI